MERILNYIDSVNDVDNHDKVDDAANDDDVNDVDDDDGNDDVNINDDGRGYIDLVSHVYVEGSYGNQNHCIRTSRDLSVIFIFSAGGK